jgi:uncharacterized SAM-binding protein YcdF (DUF218 family)
LHTIFTQVACFAIKKSVYSFEAPKFNPTDTLNILVLGGGSLEFVNLPPNDQLSLSSARRLLEGLRLNRFSHGSRMVFSGITRDINIDTQMF